MKRNNKKGFTIVELVIVIAVIAILAGVLIPTFSGIVNKAKLNAALQEAKTIMTNYTASIDYTKEQPKELYYIQVLKDDNEDDTKDEFYFFKVEKGVVEATAFEGTREKFEDTLSAGTSTFIIKADITATNGGSDDGDDWPETETVTKP